ncbi:acyl-coenzyme A diphosphatase NUDT19-like [Tubulanus polymorphus]|uniref:acyl-coenzyme A diphosphatase NUDT19-like n=1 Tax=Tubulanus polymorphus TaxID=672921 RepID=UPI003DA5681E
MTMQIAAKFQRPWRTAATLMIASIAKRGGLKNNGTSNSASSGIMKPNRHHDFEIMMLKRSGQSKSFANQYVFPGGVIDAADFSEEWIPIFEKSGLDMLDSNSHRLKTIVNENRIELYTDFDEAVLSEIAYRICAIRETFEESGILFAKSLKTQPQSQDLTNSAPKNRFVRVYKPESPNLLEQWRNKVHDNGAEFINMCKQLEVIPDIFGLIEWSNWLTPITVKRRFDTVFYLCFTDTELDAVQDQKEMTMLEWYDPEQALRNFKKGQVNLAPPQVYELSRLWQFPSMESMLEFSVKRSSNGCQRIYPVPIQLDNAYMHVFPGDELYPKYPNFNQPEKPVEVVSGTLEERNKMDKRKHRYTFASKSKWPAHGQLFVNVDFPDGQIAGKDLNDPTSKL